MAKKQERFTHKVAQFIHDALSDMDEESLIKVIKEAKGLTETNCWWIEYDLRKAVISIAEFYLYLAKAEKAARSEGGGP